MLADGKAIGRMKDADFGTPPELRWLWLVTAIVCFRSRIPRTEAHVIWHFQERMPYGLCVPDVPTSL